MIFHIPLFHSVKQNCLSGIWNGNLFIQEVTHLTGQYACYSVVYWCFMEGFTEGWTELIFGQQGTNYAWKHTRSTWQGFWQSRKQLAVFPCYGSSCVWLGKLWDSASCLQLWKKLAHPFCSLSVFSNEWFVCIWWLDCSKVSCRSECVCACVCVRVLSWMCVH